MTFIKPQRCCDPSWALTFLGLILEPKGIWSQHLTTAQVVCFLCPFQLLLQFLNQWDPFRHCPGTAHGLIQLGQDW